MRLDNERPSDNIEDRRGMGGGFGFPRGGGGFSIKTIIMLVIVYFVVKMVFGIDLLQMINGGGPAQFPQQQTQTQNSGSTQSSDSGREFVARVLGSTERVWADLFTKAGRQYQEPGLVLFSGGGQSACGTAP